MSSVAGPSRLAPATGEHPLRRGVNDEEARLLTLVAQLSIQDIDEMEAAAAASPTRRSSLNLSDAEIARRMFAEEARSIMMFNNDRALAQSLHEEGHGLPSQMHNPNPNRPTAEGALRQINNTRDGGNGSIQNAAWDGALSLRQSHSVQSHPVQAGPVQAGPVQASPEQSRQGQSSRWSSFLSNLIPWFSVPIVNPSPLSQSQPPQIPARPRPTGNNCVICQDPIMDIQIKAPCGHYYDKACVLDLFEAATRDEALFPPRCCRQQISLELVKPHMTRALASLFAEKSRELSTLKRVYCANPSCSRFLGPQAERFSFASQILTCPDSSCVTQTCGRCKAKVTRGITHSCNENQADQEVIALGNQAGWARCPGCSTMIELNMGCYHMTCLCKTEFCYLCKLRWKTCGCPQWDERRLFAAAEERVDRRLGAVGAAAERREPVQVHARPVQPLPLAPAVLYQAEHARPAASTVAPAAPPAVPPRPVVPARPAVPAQLSTAGETISGAALRRPTVSIRGFNTENESWHALSTGSSQIRRPLSVANKNSARDDLIRETVERLRVNHDCEHEKWRYRPGGGDCQHCHHTLPLYLFRCLDCETLACNRCRRNRL